MKKPLVVILAGGQGLRFEPVTVNKTMIPLMGTPFITHTLNLIASAGLEKILVTTNRDNHEFLSSYQHSNLHLTTKLQTQPLGMADALMTLAEEIGDQSIIVMNAVDLVDKQLLTNILAITDSSYAIVPGLEVTRYTPAGYLKTDGDRVVSIIEKPGEGKEPSNLINLVVHYFSKPQEFLELLKKTKSANDDQYEVALDELMKKEVVNFVKYDGFWQKLKYSYQVLDMMNLLFKNIKRNISPHAEIFSNVTIAGEVIIEEGAKIYEGAVIKGPAYIGKNVVIGNHALVRESIIEESSVVGFGSEVTRSYIGPRCMLHHNFIGDSVLESDINPSYGTCTANWRIDGKPVQMKLSKSKVDSGRTKLGAIIAKGVFMGIGCKTMPGVTIGANAKIYPDTVIKNAVLADTTTTFSNT